MFFKENNKNEAYLDYIRGLKCTVSEPECAGYRVDPHHTRQGTKAKKDDYSAIPLCRRCHSILGNMGKFEFFRQKNIDINQKIIELLIGYIKKEG